MEHDTIDLTKLPEAHYFEGQNILEPCYRCRSPGFYGDAYYEEDEVIIAMIIPNAELQPLNKAAGRAYVAWLESLPVRGGEVLTIDDLREAALELEREVGKDKLAEWGHAEASKRTQQLALAIRRRREGKDAFFIPTMSAMKANTKAPPMPNLRVTDPTVRGPGQILERAVIHDGRAAPSNVQRAAGKAAAR